MSFVNSEILTVTTAADGTVTAFTTRSLVGLLHAIQYTKPGVNPFSDGVVITVTAERTGLPIWAETLSTNASKTRYPRAAVHDVLGAAALHAAAGTALVERIPLTGERIKIAITGGGNAKTGNFTFVVADVPSRSPVGGVA
jgi:hypothetical protein